MNKFYIQIVLFLLSIFIHVNNITLASEPTPQKDTTSEIPCRCITAKDIYERNKDLLCTNPKETKEAEELMNEAVKQLKYHATDMRNYELCAKNVYPDAILYKKYLENHTPVEKVEYSVFGSYKCNKIINETWNPNHPNFLNPGDVKIVRVYNPNLVMIQQRYKKEFGSSQKYFYALATKVQISEDTTVIAYTSADINDHNPSTKKYENKIIEKANSFKTDIDSEEDIRKGELIKTFVNLAGYYIQKRGNCVDITYVESIDGHASIQYNSFWGLFCNGYYLNV
ncbi:fam-a protein [Plasmodium vinckei petteri]|uniref:Fam-a protein n=1 Tax=Plasmodium vinckei petteri TaxID=138298 RepID=A0A6V7SFM2_PLAVN|nr:fam-a protein [Plasmodium vinckei petteri]